MKQFIKIFLLLIIINLMIGCDPLTSTSIINNSKTDIIVIMHFDSTSIYNNLLEEYPVAAYFNDFETDNHIKRLEYDSLNLISHYFIPTQDSFLIHASIGTKPEINFKRLQIIHNNDTVDYKGKDFILSQFERQRYYTYILHLTDSMFVDEN